MSVADFNQEDFIIKIFLFSSIVSQQNLRFPMNEDDDAVSVACYYKLRKNFLSFFPYNFL